MKKIVRLLWMSFFLVACNDIWNANPQPFPVWTAIPSRTPSVITATPIILPPTLVVITPVTPTNTEVPSPTISPTFTPDTPTATFTSVPAQPIAVEILGCNTGFDVTHGMGEVTNAFVTVKNTGNVDLPNTCALLRAIDEGREHPDKKKCVPTLTAGNQVTFKLTVDSTYKKGTIIQVDTTSNDAILLRVDQQACTDISLFGGEPSDIGVVKPIP